ncbi:MAG: hypothetical protein AB7O59_06745 [Pirellulales bacterium]
MTRFLRDITRVRRGPAVAVLVISAFALAHCGCAAYKATQQPDKKNLAVLAPGTSRSRVVAELGAPVLSEEREGTQVDVFAFKQGYSKGEKAGRALAHGAADVVTGGLWEVVGIPAESIADGKNVKVEVTYDDEHAVESVDVFEGERVVRPRRWFGRKRKTDPAAETASQPATSRQRG